MSFGSERSFVAESLVIQAESTALSELKKKNKKTQKQTNKKNQETTSMAKDCFKLCQLIDKRRIEKKVIGDFFELTKVILTQRKLQVITCNTQRNINSTGNI